MKSLFLLEERVPRYNEILQSDLIELKKNFMLTERFKEMASSEIFNFKARLEIPSEARVPVVGMYIQSLEVDINLFFFDFFVSNFYFIFK